MKCSESCPYLVNIFSETGYHYTEEELANIEAELLGLKVDDRPSGYYLVASMGFKCSNYCCSNCNKTVRIGDDCDAREKVICDGQLTLV